MNTDCKDRLWAKSWDEGRDGRAPSHVFLPNHLHNAQQAATRLLQSTGDDQLAAVGLRPDVWRDRFRRIVLLGAAVHDLGKANDHFQGMITRKRDVRVSPQGLRHEWVTLLILQGLRQWLLPAVGALEDDFALVEWAVAGHHPALHHPSPPRECPSGSGAEMTLLTGYDDFRTALRNIQRSFELTESPPALADVVKQLDGPTGVFAEIMAWFQKARRTWQRLSRTDYQRLAALAKHCVIASDVAASALPKVIAGDQQALDWITTSLAAKPDPGDFQTIVEYRLSGHPPREFQTRVARSNASITLAKAGCGTGKTLAAYMWAAKNHPVRRLYFCYPTTGTATEGFKDYLFPPGAEADEVDPAAGLIRKIGAKLFHSRREIDLEIILGAGQDLDPAPSDVAVRLDSLEAWATPVVACTVDAVLGVIQNNKRGLFGWPALAQSAFVFDEIHAYDERLFGALLRFLRDLPGIPTLLMTASLPAPREEALRILLTSRGHEWIPIAGPDELELMPRYHRRCVAENDPLPLIRETLANGGKVLWVCNTVARVMDAADRTLDLAPLVYHSRFRYVDRVNRHNAVVRAFRPENRGASLAVCSQVAEMSLDLKGCTLLVTDLASVPALIQRLGRLNREAMPGDPTRPFVIIEPDDTLPYTSNDLTTARDWLARLRDDAISQRAIANAWEQGDEEPAVPCASAWLDGGPSTTVTELRELSPGISVILGADRSCVRKSSDITRFVIPMPPPPRRVTWHDWPRVRGIPVAPGDLIAYNPERGAQWRV